MVYFCVQINTSQCGQCLFWSTIDCHTLYIRTYVRACRYTHIPVVQEVVLDAVIDVGNLANLKGPVLQLEILKYLYRRKK